MIYKFGVTSRHVKPVAKSRDKKARSWFFRNALEPCDRTSSYLMMFLPNPNLVPTEKRTLLRGPFSRSEKKL
jgi:hypothetical protein